MALGPLVPGAASADPGRESAPIQVRIDGPSTIPFESPSGLVIMTARINGRFHVRLLLDTGDPSGLTLDLKAARTLGLPLSDKTPARATGVVGSGRYMLYRARIRSFLLGGLSARDLSVWTAPDAVLIAATIGIRVDGFVGVDLLRDLRVTIDYPARQITFAPSRPAAPPGKAGPAGPLPMRLEGNRIVCEAILNGDQKRSVILDTAAETTYIDEGDAALTRAPESGRTTQIVDSSGTAISAPVRILPELRLGDAVLHDVPVVPFDFEALNRDLYASMPHRVSGIIGSDVLSRQVVVLDFPGGALAVRPGAP